MHKLSAIRNIGAVAVFAFVTAISGAQVIDTSGVASVNVQPELSLVLVTNPDWGRVTRPPVGTARYTLNYSTGAVVNNSGDGYAFDDGAAGEFTLSGAPNGPVSFAVSIGAFTGTGITVVASHINGASNSGTDTLDGSGNLTLMIGGILDIDAGATLTAQTATVTVTVDYQ